MSLTGPRSAVGKVSGNRCESDCRSRGHEFNLGPVPPIMKYFLRSFPSLPLNHSRRAVVSYKRKYVHEVLVNCLFKLGQEKVWLGFVCLFLLLYVPCQQLWSLRDGQFT